MAANSVRTEYRSQLSVWGKAAAMAIISVVAGCESTPSLQPAEPQSLFKSELAFVKDGVTTREEAVLRLGIAAAQVEEDRILMYQLRADAQGKWHLVAPQISAITGLRAWKPQTCCLVLVFDTNGILKKHSLVKSE